jgi:hypothetical protein
VEVWGSISAFKTNTFYFMDALGIIPKDTGSNKLKLRKLWIQRKIKKDLVANNVLTM